MTLYTLALRCEYNYTSYGRTGFLYESAKDQLKWANISVKEYITTLLTIGKLTVLSKEEFSKLDKEKINNTKDIAAALIAAFGDGKKKKESKSGNS